MKLDVVVITGTTHGIGKAIAENFLKHSDRFVVHGIDNSLDECILEDKYKNYIHHRTDVRDELPIIKDVNYLINNAGVQNSEDDIGINLQGLINVCEHYAYQPEIKSVVNIASTSGHTGAEFPMYAASKGGVLTYTKALANELAKYGTTVNSISPGGVTTELNLPVIEDSRLWKRIMELTPLKKWADPSEIAEWCYFLCINNKSMTGQDIIIDNGEMSRSDFIWTF